ncbi:MAG: metallopeptidase family protein [bacterium]|nr:metallopeptidase family protein [bacterium]
MQISKQEFEKTVEQSLASLSEKFSASLNNLAIFIEDEPSPQQLDKLGLKKDDLLFGLFEGYAQGRRINVGPVLPDRITIFRKAILSQCANREELKRKIISTVKHEIAHHFGSDEAGASRAGHT